MKSILMIVGAFLQIACVSLSAGEHRSVEPRRNGMSIEQPRKKYLLLDRRLVEKVQNARLTVGTVKKHPANPFFGEELPWETDTSHMYADVIFDRQENIYKCWYFTRIKEWARDITLGSLATEGKGPGNKATLYAVSKDGIKWEKPALDVYRYKGKPTNIVFYGEHGAGSCTQPLGGAECIDESSERTADSSRCAAADGFLEMMREKRLVKCGAMGIMGAMEPERRLGQGQMVTPGKSWYLN